MNEIQVMSRMSEVPRHSVEFPLSKTLVALKKVRSLRDPTTNSISKFATVGEYGNCEGNARNGLAAEPSSRNMNHHAQTAALQLNEVDEDVASNSGSNYCPRIPNPRNHLSKKQPAVKIRAKHVNRTRRDRPSRPRKSVDSTWVHSPIKQVDDEVNSYNEATLNLEKENGTEVKSRYGIMGKSSTAVSRVGSPSISVSEPQTNGSRRSYLGLPSASGTPIKSNDVVGSNFSGCGISYCWSGTPKFRGRNLYSDDDDEQPLLSVEGTEKTSADATVPVETPSSLGYKFRPKCFTDLIGLNVVTQSLVYAITKGKVARMYLFHGPHGSGKTTTARIFAAALNCLSLEEHRPCGLCRECAFLSSGKSRDIKEFDAVKFNHKNRIKALIKSASLVPVSSRFKIFIIDECHSLRDEAWAAIFKSIDEVPQHAVYIMVTSELDALPRSSAARCQRYHFPKVKDVDIICKLQKICIQEKLEFKVDALHFIALKSNGSFRDAETMLEQLALLGKQITVSLAYELVGAVSDDELLDLLDLALSSDTANTVRRSRELMGSRVDPLQLISQLANVIMDILAGKSGLSEVGSSFIRKHALDEVGMQKLRHALKVLSETEKQLRTSKNQATWLAVALLQFNNEESSPLLEPNRTYANQKMSFLRDDNLLRTNSVMEDHRSSICSSCNHSNFHCLEKSCGSKKLDDIWKKALRKCQPNSFQNFLQQEGYLSSVSILEGMAVAEVEFYHPEHVSKAAKSLDVIASALQQVLGYSTDIRIRLAPQPVQKDVRVKKSSFNLFNCSGRNQEFSDSLTDEYETDTSTRRETSFKIYSSCHDQQLSPFPRQYDDKPLQEFYDAKAAMVKKTLENVRTAEDVNNHRSELEELNNDSELQSEFSEKGGRFVTVEEPETQPSCFAKTLNLRRKLFSSDAGQTICLRVQPQNKIEFPTPNKAASEAYLSVYDSYTLSSRSTSQITFTPKDDALQGKDLRHRPNLLCWRSPKSQSVQ